MIKVFSKEWFKKYNKAITFVARLPFIGELIFNFKKFGHYIDRKKIVEVTPNSVIEFIGYKKGKVELKQHFFVRNEYALRLQKVFYPIWIIFHTWDIITRPIPQLNLGFDTLEVNPVPWTTADGAVQANVDVNYTSWESLRANPGTDATYTLSNFFASFATTGSAGAGQWKAIYRSIFTFDTSSLTSSAIISSAVMSVYGTSKSDTLGVSPNIDVYTSSPANNSILLAGDFDSLGTISQTGSPISYSSFSTAGYNAFTFNATGRGNISKNGISKFGIRNANFDANNIAPTWKYDSHYQFSVNFGSASSNKPKLVVTYTTVVAPTVTTQSATNIATTSCTGNGNITATGGANCTRRGFCYKTGTSGDPTVSDSVAYDDGSFGTGAFTKSITGLTAGTDYRVRAYAVNSAGISYGTTVDVKTLSAFIPRTMWFN